MCAYLSLLGFLFSLDGGALSVLRLLGTDAGAVFLGFGKTRELIDTASRVDEVLLTRVERVALVTQFDADGRHGAAHGDRIPASAGNGGLLIRRVDLSLHSAERLAESSYLGKGLTFENFLVR